MLKEGCVKSQANKVDPTIDYDLLGYTDAFVEALYKKYVPQAAQKMLRGGRTQRRSRASRKAKKTRKTKKNRKQ